MQVTLSAAQTEMLRELVAAALTELRVEIRRTDTPEFRHTLMARRDALQAVLAALSPDDEVAAPA